MRQTFGQYLDSVRLFVSDMTDGVLDFDDLIDYADGEFALAEMYEGGVSPRDAAHMRLEDAGYFSFEFPEDADCGYDCEGRPIGG